MEANVYEYYIDIKVDSLYGKRAGSAWHELALSRIHGHSTDCLRECDCSPKKKCPHSHVEGCTKDACVQHRLVAKAPHMSGPARVAMLAWLSVLARRVAGRNPPVDWTREDRAAYLGKIAAVATAIEANGTKVKLSPAIQGLSHRVKQSIKDF